MPRAVPDQSSARRAVVNVLSWKQLGALGAAIGAGAKTHGDARQQTIEREYSDFPGI